jgi:hypothetical protein
MAKNNSCHVFASGALCGAQGLLTRERISGADPVVDLGELP